MKQFFLPEPVIFADAAGNTEGMKDIAEYLRACFSSGADAAYISVKFTQSSEPFVSTTGSNGSIHDETGPSLEDVLSEFADKKFCIDIPFKSIPGIKNICSVINRLGAAERIMFFSFHAANIKAARKLCPESAFAFTIMSAIGFYGLYRSGLLYFRKKFRPDALIIPEFIGPSYLGSRGLISAARARGIRVYIYGAEGDGQVKRLVSAAPDGFITKNVSYYADLSRRA